ncbi:DUF6082 family protein [Streptomyces sp. DSM 41527]|uniref:DUF6082 family protein n=1 Tax=Streptomyces mooreae TaxID=3075523 RepID=A0ABU2TE60_9ACTN|nr:DUF6082 family protein [Streptomyces sp. DSM 41527]MDT0459160.1 DUF6082 family protein [Streptomyces sp. DSM 41527]
MKITNAAILAVAAVGALRLMQQRQHQQQRNEVEVARIQMDRIMHLTSHPHLAESWAPPGMNVDEYVKLLDANHQICAVSLRHKLRITRGAQLRFVAEWIMKNEVSRRYWKEFGSLRAEEATGDPDAEEFTEAMRVAYADRRAVQPVGV